MLKMGDGHSFFIYGHHITLNVVNFFLQTKTEPLKSVIQLHSFLANSHLNHRLHQKPKTSPSYLVLIELRARRVPPRNVRRPSTGHVRRHHIRQVIVIILILVLQLQTARHRVVARRLRNSLQIIRGVADRTFVVGRRETGSFLLA